MTTETARTQSAATEGATLVVIPAFNEAASIGTVIAEVRGELPWVDVLVVDDGSWDATARIAERAGATVARIPYNLGVGGAMRVGYHYGRDHGYDAVVQLDADGQPDPRFVPLLLDGLAEADVVIGARFAGEGDYRVRGPRRWAMALLAAVLSRVARARLTDTTSGFRAVNRRAMCLFARFYPAEYLGDTIEALMHASSRGMRVTQVPVAMRQRLGGRPTQSGPRAVLYLARAVVVLFLALVRR
jgi:glycosyltransferase involved in cell wall biosynthesis